MTVDSLVYYRAIVSKSGGQQSGYWRELVEHRVVEFHADARNVWDD